jgi:hypothetical protein
MAGSHLCFCAALPACANIPPAMMISSSIGSTTKPAPNASMTAVNSRDPPAGPPYSAGNINLRSPRSASPRQFSCL